jgi:hypothetical protein
VTKGIIVPFCHRRAFGNHAIVTVNCIKWCKLHWSLCKFMVWRRLKAVQFTGFSSAQQLKVVQVTGFSFDGEARIMQMEGFSVIDLSVMSAAQLNDWYEQHVGYRPQVDDPTMTDAQLRALIRNYIEACREECPRCGLLNGHRYPCV